MQIYFMHGFNSGPNSSTGKMIKKDLGDKYAIRILSYDSSKTFQENFKQLIKEINGNDPPIFIGTSLGAYYAYHLANYFQTKCVLLNPCITPKETLEKFRGENTSFEDGHKWTLTNDAINSYAPINQIPFDGIHRFVVIGENDEVIDPIKNRDFWKINADVYILQNEGHSISSIISIKNELESFFNRVAG